MNKAQQNNTSGNSVHPLPNLIERFFNELKQLCTLAARYQKLKSTFLAAVQFSSIIILTYLTTRGGKASTKRKRPCKPEINHGFV
ncbi:transposase [Acetobacter orleanensis]|uniref:transposase n=1 Tax=Acetobacter orleanensis TaxID=104099 RepID=UPI0009E43A7E|nr:transposase [Acetobacter orleanensis]PCD78681.1 hypothetical protein CO710_10795 [Acetobacter orleanensis]